MISRRRRICASSSMTRILLTRRPPRRTPRRSRAGGPRPRGRRPARWRRHAAAVRLGYAAADRQSEAQAAALRSPSPLELCEDRDSSSSGRPGPLSRTRIARRAGRPPRRRRSGARGGVAGRVAQEVGREAGARLASTSSPAGPVLPPRAATTSTRREASSGPARKIAARASSGDVDGPPGQHEHARFDAAQGKQVLDDAVEAVGCLEGVGQYGPPGLAPLGQGVVPERAQGCR